MTTEGMIVVVGLALAITILTYILQTRKDVSRGQPGKDRDKPAPTRPGP